MDDPGGSVDDPGGGVIDDKGSFCDPSTSTTTSPKTSASFVTSSLTNRVSLLSLSDKSTVGMAGNTDYATGSFCSSCSIPPPPTDVHKLITVDSGGCGTPQFVLAN